MLEAKTAATHHSNYLELIRYQIDLTAFWMSEWVNHVNKQNESIKTSLGVLAIDSISCQFSGKKAFSIETFNLKSLI